MKYRLDELLREGMPDTSFIVTTPVGGNSEDDTTWAEMPTRSPIEVTAQMLFDGNRAPQTIVWS